jgi:predicted metal-dependent HD superfamily phosphohydrolase
MSRALLTHTPVSLPDALIQAVQTAYMNPPRAYHSFAHVQEVLSHIEEVTVGPGWRQPHEVVLAALFHDAVYVAGAADNEARSADLAAQAIDTFLPGQGIDTARVRALILRTAHHGKQTPTEVDADAAHFLDCDMAILAAEPARFDAYHAAIAEEYRNVVPAFIFNINRRRFLQTLLESPRIYLSEFFHRRLDARARANLRRVLSQR